MLPGMNVAKILTHFKFRNGVVLLSTNTLQQWPIYLIMWFKESEFHCLVFYDSTFVFLLVQKILYYCTVTFFTDLFL
jgi:hypothetical protein